MKNSLLNYDIVVDNVMLLCDNESAIKIAHNPVQHSQTKHIYICHQFLRDHVVKGDIVMSHVGKQQLAGIFTKS